MTNQSLKDAFQRFWEYVTKEDDDIRAAIEKLSENDGGGAPLVVTGQFGSGAYTVTNMSHTWDEIMAAHNGGRTICVVVESPPNSSTVYYVLFRFVRYEGDKLYFLGDHGDTNNTFHKLWLASDGTWTTGYYWYALGGGSAFNKVNLYAGAENQSPGTSLLRNSKLVSSDTNPTVNGEINWTYG